MSSKSLYLMVSAFLFAGDAAVSAAGCGGSQFVREGGAQDGISAPLGEGATLGGGGSRGGGGISSKGGSGVGGVAQGGSTGAPDANTEPDAPTIMTGGMSGSGGIISTGGAVATGGTVGSGGISSTGGAVVTGGKVGSGGISSTGGVVATGGTVGSGGISGTGSAVATGGKVGSGGVVSTGGAATGGTATGGAATGGSTSSACTVGPPSTGGAQHCNLNSSDSYGNYQWSLWESGHDGCITTYANGAFGASWNMSGDLLAGVGLAWDPSKTYEQLGTIAADFAERKAGTAGDYSYIGIYGWSADPCVEYYIVEDSYNTMPVKLGSSSSMGTADIDGGTYAIYANAVTGTGSSNCTGASGWRQFYSVRQTARQCGHISISQHFAQWAQKGMTLGKMKEAKILVEAGGGTGSIDFTTAILTAQ